MTGGYIFLFILAVVTAIIGALPFGLVNLTVLNVSLEKGSRPAMKIAHGASIIEVLYGLIAIYAGSLLNRYIEGNRLVGITTMLVLVAGGLYFLFRKTGMDTGSGEVRNGFLKGMLLNLVSIQVFLFWILAMAYLSSRSIMQYDALSVILFLAGIWIGKMLTLLAYKNLSSKLLARSWMISSNINRIIGFVLIGMAFVQFFKI